MNKLEAVAMLCDATAAGRLGHSEVEHIVDLMADWGWITLDDEVRTDNAQIEGDEVIEHPAQSNGEMMLEPAQEEPELEPEEDSVVAPRGRRPKAKPKPKAKAKPPARRSHR
jgi:hypothetical protein